MNVARVMRVMRAAGASLAAYPGYDNQWEAAVDRTLAFCARGTVGLDDDGRRSVKAALHAHSGQRRRTSLTVGRLREVAPNLPSNTPVLYQRLDDAYFTN